MVFNKDDAEGIYRIPLSRRCAPDVMTWLYNKNGRYSVKLGYHIARILLKESSHEGEGSIPRPSSNVWARLWKLHIPNKIKVFGWRACHNILPIYESYLYMKGYGREELLRTMSVPFANASLKHQSMHCGSVQLLRMCGQAVGYPTSQFLFLHTTQ